MKSSTDYVEAVQQIGFRPIAGRVCFFLTKIVQSGDLHKTIMPVDVNNLNSRLQMLDAVI